MAGEANSLIVVHGGEKTISSYGHLQILWGKVPTVPPDSAAYVHGPLLVTMGYDCESQTPRPHIGMIYLNDDKHLW